MGNDSYCLVAGDYSYAIKSQAGAISTAFGSRLTFQFFDKTSCVFEYSTTSITNKEPFSQLIIRLMDIVNTKYAEVLRNKAQRAKEALNNKASKS